MIYYDSRNLILLYFITITSAWLYANDANLEKCNTQVYVKLRPIFCLPFTICQCYHVKLNFAKVRAVGVWMPLLFNISNSSGNIIKCLYLHFSFACICSFWCFSFERKWGDTFSALLYEFQVLKYTDEYHNFYLIIHKYTVSPIGTLWNAAECVITTEM